MSNLRHQKVVYLTGTLPGKLVIVKPILVTLYTYPDHVYALQNDTMFYAAEPSKGEALARLKDELVSMLKYLKQEEVDEALPLHIHAVEMKQLAYLREHIVPQGSERAKKRG
jgi:hypothetical protein